jgi:hypothetical protein
LDNNEGKSQIAGVNTNEVVFDDRGYFNDSDQHKVNIVWEPSEILSVEKGMAAQQSLPLS